MGENLSTTVNTSGGYLSTTVNASYLSTTNYLSTTSGYLSTTINTSGGYLSTTVNTLSSYLSTTVNASYLSTTVNYLSTTGVSTSGYLSKTIGFISLTVASTEVDAIYTSLTVDFLSNSNEYLSMTAYDTFNLVGLADLEPRYKGIINTFNDAPVYAAYNYGDRVFVPHDIATNKSPTSTYTATLYLSVTNLAGSVTGERATGNYFICNSDGNTLPTCDANHGPFWGTSGVWIMERF